MTSDTKKPGGWPGAPGVPENPEQDGWHWLLGATETPAVLEWRLSISCWPMRGWYLDRGGHSLVTAAEIAPAWRYLGPCLTPAEVAAREAAAAEAMRAQIATWISEVRDFCIRQRDAAQNKVVEDLYDALARDRAGILDGIARMPAPAPAALARVRAEAVREGMERAAGIAGTRHEYWGMDGRNGKAACDDIAAAIRAAALEVKPQPLPAPPKDAES